MTSEIAGFVSTNCGPIITSLGLFMDIFGAFLISNELFNKISPNKHLKGEVLASGHSFIKETDEGKLWAQKHYTKMLWGLIFLIIGFTMQAVGAWIP